MVLKGNQYEKQPFGEGVNHIDHCACPGLAPATSRQGFRAVDELGLTKSASPIKIKEVIDLGFPVVYHFQASKEGTRAMVPLTGVQVLALSMLVTWAELFNLCQAGTRVCDPVGLQSCPGQMTATALDRLRPTQVPSLRISNSGESVIYPNVGVKFGNLSEGLVQWPEPCAASFVIYPGKMSKGNSFRIGTLWQSGEGVDQWGGSLCFEGVPFC